MTKDINLKEWMNDTNIKDKTLADIILPGTHDSGAFKTSKELTPKRTLINKKIFGKNIAISQERLAELKLVQNWTITQKYNIREQLEMGVRLFDFRVSNIAKEGEPAKLVLSHTFGCTDYKDALDQISKFLKNHPSEVVVVTSKSDWDNKSTMNYDAERTLLDITKQTLENQLIPEKEHKTATPIRNLAGKVAFQYTKRNEQLKDNTGLIRTEPYFSGIWVNTPKTKGFNETLHTRYKEKETDEPDNKMIHAGYNVTPDKRSIIGNLFSGLKGQAKNLQEPYKEFVSDLYHEKTNNNISPKYQKLNGISLDFPTTEMIKSLVLINQLGKTSTQGKSVQGFDFEKITTDALQSTVDFCKNLSTKHKVSNKQLQAHTDKIASSLQPMTLLDPSFDTKEFNKQLFQKLQADLTEKKFYQEKPIEKVNIMLSKTGKTIKDFCTKYITKNQNKAKSVHVKERTSYTDRILQARARQAQGTRSK